MNCVNILPGNNLSATTSLMAEAHWHTFHGRTSMALDACEKAWSICLENFYLVTFNSNVLCQLVTSLRLHAEELERRGEAKAIDVRRASIKWPSGPIDSPGLFRPSDLMRCANSAWPMPSRETAACTSTRRLKLPESRRNGSLLRTCSVLLALGQIGTLLKLPEAEGQILQAKTRIQEIEAAVDAELGQPGVMPSPSVMPPLNNPPYRQVSAGIADPPSISWETPLTRAGRFAQVRSQDCSTLYIGSRHDAIFETLAGFDNDGGFVEQVLLHDVNTVAASLTESTADAFVGDHQRSQEAGAFNGLSSVIDLRSNLSKLNRVVARGCAFIDAQLTGFCPGMGQAGLQIDERQSHASVSLFFQWQCRIAPVGQT